MAALTSRRLLCAVLGAVSAFQVVRTLPLTPWPYLQVYPPVNESDGRTPLYFVLMLSFGGDYTSIGALPGVQIALDYINSQSDILPGYSLHYTLTDSQCNRSIALKAFFQQINSEPTKVGWVGSGCSVATEPTAEVTQFYNITQVSCASSSSELKNRQRFRYYFQLNGEEAGMARGFAGLIKAFGWRRVAIITQNENLFTVTMDVLKQLLTDNDVNFTETLFKTEDGITGLGPQIFDPEVRIFVVAMYSTHARNLVCKAYEQNIRYPKYMLITYGWYSDSWWAEPASDSRFNCSAEERASVLQYTLGPIQQEFFTEATQHVVTETGLTGAEFNETYSRVLGSEANMEINLTSYVPSPFLYAQHCHEAVIALAYALNRTITDLKEDSSLNMEAAEASGFQLGEGFTLANFTYSNSVVVSRIVRRLQETMFPGLTGNEVSFDEDGIREVDTLTIYQYQPMRKGSEPLKVITMGTVTETDNATYLFNYTAPYSDSSLETWPDGIPNDGIPIEEMVTVAVSLTVVFMILATAGLIFTAVCLAFNFIFRKKKLIRLSSPNLNYIIGLGAIVLYAAVIFLVIPTTNSDVVLVICNVSPWLISLGYSLCFGTILVKMIRVWYIFNITTARKSKVMKDGVLALFVLCLVVIDVVILGLFTVVTSVTNRLGLDRVLSRENPEDIKGPTAEVHQNYIYVCDASGLEALLAVLYGYKGLLQVTALILAFRTRKVKVKGLDDSKYIAASIYITSIVLAVIIVATYTLTDYVNVFPTVLGTGFLLGTTMILVLVFVPRMVGLYKDPNGEKIAVSASIPARESSLELHPGEEVKGLRRRITELERSLRHYEMPQTTPISTDSVSGSKVKFTIAENDMEHDQGGMKHGQNNGLSMRPQNEVREVISTRL